MYLETKDGQQAGYWRKANQIHSWFVHNVQGGVDNCGTYPVSHTKLKELKETCERVIVGSKLIKGKVIDGQTFNEGRWQPNFKDGMIVEDPSIALELLPPSKGFFFGSDYIDEWYLDDLKETLRIIDSAMESPDGDITYTASW